MCVLGAGCWEGWHLVLEEDRRKIAQVKQKVNRGREVADLEICKSFILAGSQSMLDLSLDRMSFGLTTLIHKTDSKFN